jgi:coniferyl-aldehyde dehydrogenase
MTDQTLEQMDSIYAAQRAAFSLSPMPSLPARKQQLTRLRNLLVEHKQAFAAAINDDFIARSTDETMLAEILPCIQHIDYTLKHLRSWMKPDIRSIKLHFMPATARVVYQPLGVVGIIAPFNYPINLCLMPLIAALAAGNRAMIKMSEHTPKTAALMRDMLRNGFDENQVAIITGEVDIAAAFGKLPFDHLLFTGSIATGKKVMRAAAENLTPVTLELGGKSPAIIADDIPLAHIVDRLCYAKALNGGQTCIAPDYILLPRGKLEAFFLSYKSAFKKMYPAINGNPDYTSLINADNQRKLLELLQDAQEKGARIEIITDEIINDGTLRMPLHLVTQVSDAMQIMQQELFGPILPVIPYDNIDEAIAYVQQRPRPLALYLFTYDSALQQRITYHTHAGSMCINDAVIHFAVDDLPFGGIGTSGMGRYHGREGFLTLSNSKAILHKGRFNSMKYIYPPYGGIIQKWLIKYLIH